MPPRDDGFRFDSSVNPDSQDSVDVTVYAQTVTSESPRDDSNLPVIAKKGRLIRLERGIQEELLSLCQDEGLTLELFVEAAFLNIRRNERLLRRVLTEAGERKEKRKWAAMVRRARTLSQKYQS